MSDQRPNWDQYFMSIAHTVSERASCNRRKCGVVLVSPEHRIVSTGYNGAPAGWDDCLSTGCELDDQGHCIRTIHSELNAVITAAKHGISTDHTTAYIYGAPPCPKCALLLAQAGIKVVYYQGDYHTYDGPIILEQHGIPVYDMLPTQND